MCNKIFEFFQMMSSILQINTNNKCKLKISKLIFEKSSLRSILTNPVVNFCTEFDICTPLRLSVSVCTDKHTDRYFVFVLNYILIDYALISVCS